MNVDFAPTLLDFAGVDIPDDIQGKSLKPILTNRKQDSCRFGERRLITIITNIRQNAYPVKRHYGIRTADFKLIHFYNDVDEWEMYDFVRTTRMN